MHYEGELLTQASQIGGLSFLDSLDTDSVLLSCLDQLMNFYRSDYGFIYIDTNVRTKNLTPDVPQTWELVASCIIDKDRLRIVKSSVSSAGVSPSLLSYLNNKDFFYSNSEIPVKIPEPEKTVNSLACFPLKISDVVCVVFCLCNTATELKEEQLVSLRPFLSSAALILQTEKQTSLSNIYPAVFDDRQYCSLLAILNNLFNGVVFVNDDGEITFCNNSALRLLALSHSEAIGKPIKNFITSDSSLIQALVANNRRADDTFFNSDSCAKRSHFPGVLISSFKGDKSVVNVNLIRCVVSERVVRGIVFSDSVDDKIISNDYHSIVQRYQVITNYAPVGLIQLNKDWECIYVNDAWCEYCHLTPGECYGLGWINGINSDDLEGTLNSIRVDLSSKGRYSNKLRLKTPLGRITWVTLDARSLFYEDGSINGVVISVQDITDYLKKERELKDIAETDQLTGLVNRSFFNDRLEVAINGIKRFGAIALLFIDLDKFKQINDTLGHEFGDELLKQVGERLTSCLRRVDTIARIGGDEFTVLMTNISNMQAITTATEKLIDSFSEPFILGQQSVYVTCSIGITVGEDDHTRSKSLLRQADAALYKAKEAGRNQYKFYTPELDKSVNLLIDLRKSLRESPNDDFRVVYQPQVHSVTGNIVGIEALSRWSSPLGEDIHPDMFIRMIEDSGLINEFSEWLFEKVFKDVHQLREQFTEASDIKISVNLSVKQFRNRDLVKYLGKLCVEYAISPACFVLEVTETAFIDDPKLANLTLAQLKELGFSIALDDFGTGYSSLSHLRTMPIKIVKIDKTFVNDVIHDPEDAKIVSSIISLVHTLEMDVIAEGVENTEIKSWMEANNCFVQQGFYYYEPMPLEDICHLLKNRS